MEDSRNTLINSESVLEFFISQLFADNLITPDCVIYLKKRVKEDFGDERGK